jgi:flagellar basal-body rod protein FlgC
MSLFTVFKISAQGMSAQRERLEAASSNLANANSTRTADGGQYRRRDLVFEATPVVETAASEVPFGTPFDSVLYATRDAAQGVTASTQLAPADQVIKRFDPNHPDADANGYVSLPDVDPLEETVNMLSAARSFEANATAFNTAKELARASLKLGD